MDPSNGGLGGVCCAIITMIMMNELTPSSPCLRLLVSSGFLPTLVSADVNRGADPTRDGFAHDWPSGCST